ncbi:hypothetical protein Tco_0570895 [Tanacetum coccineum]
MAGEDDQNINNQPPNPPPPTQQAPHTVIQNGNGPVSISTYTQGQIKIPPPKSAEEILAREKERKARTTLLMALPEDHLARFHNISDAKEIGQAEEEEEDHALMAFNSNSSSNEVQSCSDECVASYNKLKQLYNEQREQLGDASIEIQAYTQALKKVEAQLVAHQQSQLWYKEKIKFMKINLDDKTNVLTYHKKLLAEAEKEKEDLKAKVEKWHNSSKNLNNLLNSPDIFQSVFVSRTSKTENSLVNDRYAEGMNAVPPPMTGIYIPSGHDKEIDDSQFTYGLKQSKPSKSDTRSSDFNSCKSNCSEETHESMPEPVVNKPKVVNEPKVWSDAPIIEEYESDSEYEHVSLPTKEQEIPSFAFINTDKHVKSPRKTVIEQNTCSQSPKPTKRL